MVAVSEVAVSVITGLLTAANRGDESARGQLFAELYPELRRLAHARMQGNRSATLLGTTALVHESSPSPVTRIFDGFKASDVFSLGLVLFELLTGERSEETHRRRRSRPRERGGCQK